MSKYIRRNVLRELVAHERKAGFRDSCIHAPMRFWAAVVGWLAIQQGVSPVNYRATVDFLLWDPELLVCLRKAWELFPDDPQIPEVAIALLFHDWTASIGADMELFRRIIKADRERVSLNASCGVPQNASAPRSRAL